MLICVSIYSFFLTVDGCAWASPSQPPVEPSTRATAADDLFLCSGPSVQETVYGLCSLCSTFIQSSEPMTSSEKPLNLMWGLREGWEVCKRTFWWLQFQLIFSTGSDYYLMLFSWKLLIGGLRCLENKNWQQVGHEVQNQLSILVR